MCRVLGVHLQAHLVGVALRLGGDPLGVGLGLGTLRGHLLAGGGHQTVGLHGGVLDEYVRLLLGDPQDRLELLARRSLFAVGLRCVDEFGRESRDLLLGIGCLCVRRRQLALESFAGFALLFAHRFDGFLFAGLCLGDVGGGLLELVAKGCERGVDLSLVVAAEAHGERACWSRGGVSISWSKKSGERSPSRSAVPEDSLMRFMPFWRGHTAELRLHPDGRDRATGGGGRLGSRHDRDPAEVRQGGACLPA